MVSHVRTPTPHARAQSPNVSRLAAPSPRCDEVRSAADDMRTRDKKGDHVRRIGILFSGGPAPAANAVISAAATSFLEDDREVVGFFHGYSNLQDYHPVSH